MWEQNIAFTFSYLQVNVDKQIRTYYIKKPFILPLSIKVFEKINQFPSHHQHQASNLSHSNGSH